MTVWRHKLLVAVSLLTLSGCVSAVTEDGDTASLSPSVNAATALNKGDTNTTANNNAATGKAVAANGGYVDPALVASGGAQQAGAPQMACLLYTSDAADE